MSQSVISALPNQKKQILQAISGEVQLPHVSRKYALGVLFTAGAILLLPLLYLTVMALLLGSLIVLLLQNDRFFSGCHWTIRWMAFGFCFSLLIACILGLIKPFFARSITHIRPQSLNRRSEPFLFEYVERLCRAIGTRMPTEIHISCELNAAAEFRSGWKSILGARDVSLYLGLPLVAGLSLRQFTGVLAHEMGHFTQHTAMWLENIVRRTNLWFHQAAHERDAVDEWLSWRCSQGGLLAWPFFLATFVVWMTRRVLLGLAKAGTVIDCLMSRQMEFNADHYQVRTVGSKTLSITLYRLRELALAHQISFRDVSVFLDEGRLPDDLAALVVANTAFITPKMKKKIRRMMVQEITGLFDSHPSDQDRILAAFADGSAGMAQVGAITENLPASILFHRFEETSKTITTKYFETALKQKINARVMHPVESLLDRQSVQIRAAKALNRYFQTEVPQTRPLSIDAQAACAPENPKDIANELKLSRERMLVELTEYKRLSTRYRTAEESLHESQVANAHLQASAGQKSNEQSEAEISPAVVADKLSRSREAVKNLGDKLLAFETEAANRLSFALQLVHVSSVVQKIENGDDLPFEISELLPVARYVCVVMNDFPSLRESTIRLQAYWERLKNAPPNQTLNETLLGKMKSFHERLTSIQADMGDRLYPFDHAQAETRLCDYLLPYVPENQNLGGLVEVAEQLQSRLLSLQVRLFARLAQAAEKIEAAIGLPPLPEPRQDVE